MYFDCPLAIAGGLVYHRGCFHGLSPGAPQFAGVMELVDVVDSKSHSSVVTTSAEALDFSRKFDNSICK